MNLEAPTITRSTYGSNTSNLLSGQADQFLTSDGTGSTADWVQLGGVSPGPTDPIIGLKERFDRRHQAMAQKNATAMGFLGVGTTEPSAILTTTKNMSTQKAKRLVQIYVVDPHPDVPLDKSVLYSQPTPILTDATDQELFFQIDMKQILHDHNGVRVKTVDKEASKSFNKEVYLEPVRIRDLVMNILTIAQF